MESVVSRLIHKRRCPIGGLQVSENAGQILPDRTEPSGLCMRNTMKLEITPDVANVLGHYVYVYVDPRSMEVFYVGKGVAREPQSISTPRKSAGRFGESETFETLVTNRGSKSWLTNSAMKRKRFV